MAIFNDSSKKHFRRNLRNAPTYAERALWYGHRNNGAGAKFRRQESIGSYVVDFYCPELSLAIEVDGISHDGREEHDAARDTRIAEAHVTILRFTDTEVIDSSDAVHAKIRATIEKMRAEGRSVRKPSERPSPQEKLRASLARDQPPPDPLLKKEGENVQSSAGTSSI